MSSRFAPLVAALLLYAAPAFAAPKVVASIKPVHSLVAAVMEGVGEPALIIGATASPHAYSLKPSQAAQLQNADIVFWVGEELEIFLEKPLETIAGDAIVVELSRAEGIELLSFREGGAFKSHDGDGHEGDGHEDERGHEAHDPHVWLDPQNAKTLTPAIADALASADPQNAKTYRENADGLAGRLDELTREISTDLADLREKRFIVFHDGYRYFEERFGVTAAGSLTVTPDVMPGAERIAELRAAIGELGVACIFSEPQFDPSLAEVTTEGMAVRSAVLDPLGATLDPGPDLYFDLIRGMAASFKACLTEEI